MSEKIIVALILASTSIITAILTSVLKKDRKNRKTNKNSNKSEKITNPFQIITDDGGKTNIYHNQLQALKLKLIKTRKRTKRKK